MLWHGDILTGPGQIFLGTAASAILGLIGVLATAGTKIRWAVEVLIAASYLSVVPIVTQALPTAVADSRPNALVLLGLASLLLLSIHWSFSNRTKWRQAATKIHKDVVTTPPSPVVQVFSSAKEYHQAVVRLESSGNECLYVQNRIAPYFLPLTAVKHIADLRHGVGPFRDEYIQGQAERRDAFFALMARHAAVRELYSRQRLLAYIETGTHFANQWPLRPEHMVALLNEWRNAILRFRTYSVAIADESVPMKYHVIDRRHVVLHEPIGRGDSHRVNSIFIEDNALGRRLSQDFELVWSLTDPEWREPKRIAKWISDELIPLARARERLARPVPQRGKGPK